MAIKQVDEFNITNYTNIANASASNVQISVEMKITRTDNTRRTFTRDARFIQDIWNPMAADADGREVLRRIVNELAHIRAMVALGEATYAEYR